MPILLLGALEAEISEFRDRLEERRDERWHGNTFCAGRLGRHAVVVAAAGVGKSMSALTTQHLVDVFAPKYIIFTGIAGALNPSLEIGDIVAAADSLQYDLDARAAGFPLGQIPFSDYRIIPGDQRLLAAALSYEARGFHLVRGRILTGDLFLSRSTPGSYGHLVSELAGDAVEMEGASVGLVALVNRVPFLLLRVISDRADGSAASDFKKFLPIASRRTFLVVSHVLDELEGSGSHLDPSEDR